MRSQVLVIIGAIALGIGAAMFKKQFSPKPADIQSVSTPLNEQQRLILLFERQAQCRAHSPCFDSVVDGALERNRGRAVEACNSAANSLALLQVPTGLPVSVSRDLEKFRDTLLSNAEGFLATAEGRSSFGSKSTCDAYATINRINKLYGLDAMMQGQYINCKVLDSMQLDSPSAQTGTK